MAEHFGQDAAKWTPGTRRDDAGRAVAAYLARRQFGYSVNEVAAALGYRGHGGVYGAVVRVEAGETQLQRTAAQLEAKLSYR